MCAAGTQPMDVLFNAIGWSQLPTFLNKVNLLQDSVAAMFGKDADAVPNDLFAWIGQYAQHWWSVLHGQAGTGYEEKRTSILHSDSGENGTHADAYNITYWTSDATKQTLEYSKSIAIDQTTGVVSLNNPATLTFSTASSAASKESCAALAALAPCYISGLYGDPDAVYFLPVGTNYTTGGNDARTTFCYTYSDGDYWAYLNQNTGVSVPAYAVSSQVYNIPAGETTFVHSSDRNAYPDSGTVDGLTYTYLGIPFDNAVTAPKIATGSYTGTGTYGSDKKNSLTFDFIPKFFMCSLSTYGFQSGANGWVSGFIWAYGETETVMNPACNLHVTQSGNTLSWYVLANEGDASKQCNSAGRTYVYIAIG